MPSLRSASQNLLRSSPANFVSADAATENFVSSLASNKKHIPRKNSGCALRAFSISPFFQRWIMRGMSLDQATPKPAKKSSSDNGKSSLAERLQRLEQQKARLQLAEAKIKTDERKARTRRLIELGALVDKAGLDALPANALYGALLETAKKASDGGEIARWETIGGRAFAQEAKARDADKEPLVLSLPGSQPAAVAAALRAAGMRWNKVMRHWEGLARYDEVLALANEHGGSLRRVLASAESLSEKSDRDTAAVS